MESIIYNTKQQRIVELVQEIFEVKRQQQEKQLIKLIKAVEILRQVPVQTEKHIRRVELILEQIRIQREILGQWPLTHVLLRKQLQQPIINLAIEQLLRKQEFFLEEPTLMTLPVIRRREMLEQVICEELFQLLNVHKEVVLPVLPWTTFEQEHIPMLWANQTIVLPTQRRWVEKLLEQIELVVPRMYKEEVVVRSVVPLLKELVYNTMVPRWWFFEQAKLYNQQPRHFFEQEKLVEKELMYNTMIPRCFGEEKIVKEVVLPTGEKIVKKEVILPTGEKVVKEILVLPTGEKIVKKEYVVPTTPYTTLYNQVPRQFFEQEEIYNQLPCIGEEKIVKEVVLPTGEKIVKKEIVVPTTPYTTLYNQVPRRHFLGQEEKLVEKELMYNTMIPRCFGEEKIVKEVVLPTGEKIVKKEIILPTGEKIVKEFVVPALPYTMPVEEKLVYKQVPRHFFEEEKLVEKVLPRSFSTTFVPRHVEEQLVEQQLVEQQLIRPTIMGLEQPTFCHYPEHILAHQPRRLF